MAPLFLLSLAHAQSPELTPALVTQLQRGTVLLHTPKGEGSGFFVGDELVITNAHVVEGVAAGASIELVVDSGTPSAQPIEGLLLYADPSIDLAMVLTSPMTGRALVVTEHSPRELESVVAMGFPAGSTRTFIGDSPPVSLRPGAVTALHRDSMGLLAYVEHNANMQFGSSGGPLVNRAGEVVGVNVAMLQADQTTKLAIPSARLLAWMELTRRAIVEGAEQPSAAVATAAATDPVSWSEAPVIQSSLAVPFSLGLVAEAGVGPGGTAYALTTYGSVWQLVDDREWVDLHAGAKNRDLAVDDITGEVYVVRPNGKLYRYTSGRWMLFGPAKVRVVSASGGTVWAVLRDGRTVRYVDGGWELIPISGIPEDVVACAGFGMLQAGDEVWMHDGQDLLDDALFSGVSQLACYQDRVYGLTTDGQVVDITAQTLIDPRHQTTGLYPTPDGLLTTSNGSTLWYYDAAYGVWARVEPL